MDGGSKTKLVNMKKLTIIISVFALSSASAQMALDQDRLHEVVQELWSTSGFKSQTAVSELNAIIQKPSNAEDSLTAKTLLACYLLEGSLSADVPGKTNSLPRMYSLCAEIIQSKAETWHGAVAYIVQAAAKDFEGERKASISIAMHALKAIDFDEMEKNKYAAWLVIRKYLGGRPYGLQEYLKMFVATAFCDDHRLPEAEAMAPQIQDKVFKKIAMDRIALGWRELEQFESAMQKGNDSSEVNTGSNSGANRGQVSNNNE